MIRLPEDTQFDEVIPLLARSFGSQGSLEELTLASFAEEVYDTPDWQLIEEAVESGHLAPEEIHYEFGEFFRDELSAHSWNELRSVDRAFLQAAALGDASSLWILGLRLARAAIAGADSDERVDLDQDALFLFVEAAEAGDARAQWMLGERFSRMKDGLDESIRLLGMSAEQKFERARIRLEELFQRRYTFIHAPSETKWLLRFARAGVVGAQFDLANDLYLRGDLKAAFAWMVHAAKAGDTPAQQRLAFYYEVGEGCSRDRQRAEYWRNFATRTVEPKIPHSAGTGESEVLSLSPAEPGANLEMELPVDAREVPEAAVEELLFAEAEGLPKSEIENEVIDEIGDEIETGSEGAEPECKSEIPILTAEESLLEAEEIPPQEDADLLEDPNLPNAEPKTEFVDLPEPFNPPIVPGEQRKGLASRFRSGLAGVLRRLAEKVSGSSSSGDNDND